MAEVAYFCGAHLLLSPEQRAESEPTDSVRSLESGKMFLQIHFFFAERDVNMLPNRPLQTASVDSSKIFERRNWDALGQSLLEHGVSALLV